MRNKLPRVALLALVTLAVAAASVVVLRGANSDGKASQSHDDQSAPKLAADSFRPTKGQWEGLQVAVVESNAFRGVQITDGAIGTNDNTTVNVFSPYSGRVSRAVARVGDVVKKGDPLIYVEATEFVQGQNDLVAALAAVRTAGTQLRQAEKNENRTHELYLAKAGALKDWQQSQSDLVAAQNNLRSAEVALGAVRNRLRILGKSESDVAALEGRANVESLGAEAAVTAPISGTVMTRQVGVGQYIQSASAGGTNPIFMVSDLSTVWLVANMREADVGSVRVGQQVDVRVVAYPQRVFSARITFVSPSVDPNTHRVPVRAEIANRDGALKPAMAASFTIYTSDATQALSIPQSAVVYEGATARVFVVRDDGTVQARTIEPGRQNGDRIEVRSGLNANEKVVSGGALFIDRAVKGAEA